jgi:hypothetical protein
VEVSVSEKLNIAGILGGDIRVVDESGEDYLYAAEYFVYVDLARSV